MKLSVFNANRRMLGGALALLMTTALQPLGGEAMVLQANGNGAATPRSTSQMLSGISGLVKWVSEITPLLRQQGNEADRNKLRGSLRSISQQLAATGTINDAVVVNLEAAPPDYDRLRNQLTELRSSDASIASLIAAIRSQLHLTGQTETDLERNASDAMMAKGAEVETMLRQLQYSAPKSPEEVRVLRVKSEELKALLRKADDAISKAYQALGQ